MKLSIEQPQLIAALTQATGIVERKNTFPILGNVLLSASDGKVSIKASDLDIEITTSVQADIEDDGATTVSASMFSDIVKRLAKSALVYLSMEGNQLHIKSGKSEFNIATLDAVDFPVMASDVYENTATIASDEFSSLFSRTSFAVSTEETRYYLNGVYMHNDESGNLVGVATDGHRLAKMELNRDATVSPMIVPRKTVAQIQKLPVGVDVTIETSASKMRVTCGDLVIVSKVIDGTYPEYTRVIPTGNDRAVTVGAKEFNAAIGRVIPVSAERARGVKLAIETGKMTLSVKSSEGDAIDEIEVEYEGEPFEVGYNSKYLSEIAAQAEDGNLVMMFSGSSTTDPVLIRPDAYEGLTTVCMGMRV